MGRRSTQRDEDEGRGALRHLRGVRRRARGEGARSPSMRGGGDGRAPGCYAGRRAGRADSAGGCGAGTRCSRSSRSPRGRVGSRARCWSLRSRCLPRLEPPQCPCGSAPTFPGRRPGALPAVPRVGGVPASRPPPRPDIGPDGRLPLRAFKIGCWLRDPAGPDTVVLKSKDPRTPRPTCRWRGRRTTGSRSSRSGMSGAGAVRREARGRGVDVRDRPARRAGELEDAARSASRGGPGRGECATAEAAVAPAPRPRT